jgi:hypothetical protein
MRKVWPCAVLVALLLWEGQVRADAFASFNFTSFQPPVATNQFQLSSTFHFSTKANVSFAFTAGNGLGAPQPPAGMPNPGFTSHAAVLTLSGDLVRHTGTDSGAPNHFLSELAQNLTFSIIGAAGTPFAGKNFLSVTLVAPGLGTGAEMFGRTGVTTGNVEGSNSASTYGDPNAGTFTFTSAYFSTLKPTTPQMYQFDFAGIRSATGQTGMRFSPQAHDIIPFTATSIIGQFDVTVPEPASVVLAGLGILGLAGYGWRRRRRA